jgi:hypothetical protein
MITIGYAVGIKANNINSIFENRISSLDNRKTRYATAFSLSKHHGVWSVKQPKQKHNKSKNRSGVVKLSDVQMSLANDFAKRIESEWHTYTKETKRKFATALGLRLQQLSAKISHYHGKFANKKAKLAA